MEAEGEGSCSEANKFISEMRLRVKEIDPKLKYHDIDSLMKVV